MFRWVMPKHALESIFNEGVSWTDDEWHKVQRGLYNYFNEVMGDDRQALQDVIELALHPVATRIPGPRSRLRRRTTSREARASLRGPAKVFPARRRWRPAHTHTQALPNPAVSRSVAAGVGTALRYSLITKPGGIPFGGRWDS